MNVFNNMKIHKSVVFQNRNKKIIYLGWTKHY